MNKTSTSETGRLRESKRRKREKSREERLKYYQANKERVNWKRCEKRQKAKESEVAQSQTVSEAGQARGATDAIDGRKKYDWALYKRRRRARAMENLKKKEKLLKNKRTSEGPAFPTRMSKKRKVDLVKSHLPKSLAKIAAFVEALTKVRRQGNISREKAL